MCTNENNTNYILKISHGKLYFVNSAVSLLYIRISIGNNFISVLYYIIF